MTLFKKVDCKMQIRLAPVFLTKLSAGIKDYLNTLTLKHISSLNGVIIQYQNIRILNQKAIMKTESPFIHFNIKVEFTVFSPIKDSILVGVVNKVSPDHIGCVVYGIFNASIAKNQLESFEWDNDKHLWKSNETTIEPGSVIKFSVIRVVTLNEIMAIHGSFVQLPGCGVLDVSGAGPVAALMPLEDETVIEETAEEPEIQQVVPSKDVDESESSQAEQEEEVVLSKKRKSKKEHKKEKKKRKE